ncbi:hypothetical protein GCM10007103_22140 [Salinimicrobium marinum]|uniref:Uncharacterized protein n=1 Tax=Salinimicrobium marinum TaxID=680283 RepID=A0A918VZE0_9FLAO|nr:hypothetical protein GCM10007103_22140 [Salinimicrobium marinum]
MYGIYKSLPYLQIQYKYRSHVTSHVIKVKPPQCFERVSDKLKLEENPDFFHLNSIAILFLYLRTIISKLTLQSNTGVIMLDKMNLSSLKEILIENNIWE